MGCITKDIVGFNKDGAQIIGIIVRLNHKTVTIITRENHRWRVSYNYLFKVIDADVINQFEPKRISHLDSG
jgi:hypothetical protein